MLDTHHIQFEATLDNTDADYLKCFVYTLLKYIENVSPKFSLVIQEVFPNNFSMCVFNNQL